MKKNSFLGGHPLSKLRINPIISIIILLAIIGIGLNFTEFLQEILMTIVIVGIIFIGYKWYMNSNKSARSSDRQAYSKAAKQSSKKYTSKSPIDFLQKKTNQKNNSAVKKKRKPTSSTHLTVIEGDKGKKKDKASL